MLAIYLGCDRREPTADWSHRWNSRGVTLSEVPVKRIDVVKKGEQWVGESGGKAVTRAPTKADAVKRTAAVARADKQPVTVKIHKESRDRVAGR